MTTLEILEERISNLEDKFNMLLDKLNESNIKAVVRFDDLEIDLDESKELDDEDIEETEEIL